MLFMILLFFFFVLLFFWSERLWKNYPPGPKAYPFVGNFPLLISTGKHPFEIAKNDRKLYGDISILKIFNKDIVFLNSTKLIREVLTMEICAGRSTRMHVFKCSKLMGIVDPDIGKNIIDITTIPDLLLFVSELILSFRPLLERSKKIHSENSERLWIWKEV